MMKILLPFVLLASVFMLLGCPGQPCDPRKIYDCAMNCVDEAEVDSAVGDGICDEGFNCNTFDFDGGDCSGPITTECNLDSVLNSRKSVWIDRISDGFGGCLGVYLSIGVETQGCVGEFYFKATSQEWDTYSDCVVINFKKEDAGKKRWFGPLHFDGNRFCDPVGNLNFELEYRKALPGGFWFQG